MRKEQAVHSYPPGQNCCSLWWRQCPAGDCCFCFQAGFLCVNCRPQLGRPAGLTAGQVTSDPSCYLHWPGWTYLLHFTAGGRAEEPAKPSPSAVLAARLLTQVTDPVPEGGISNSTMTTAARAATPSASSWRTSGTAFQEFFPGRFPVPSKRFCSPAPGWEPLPPFPASSHCEFPCPALDCPHWHLLLTPSPLPTSTECQDLHPVTSALEFYGSALNTYPGKHIKGTASFLTSCSGHFKPDIKWVLL